MLDNKQGQAVPVVSYRMLAVGGSMCTVCLWSKAMSPIQCEGGFTIREFTNNLTTTIPICQVRDSKEKLTYEGTLGECLASLAREQLYPWEFGVNHSEREREFYRKYPVLARQINIMGGTKT